MRSEQPPTFGETARATPIHARATRALGWFDVVIFGLGMRYPMLVLGFGTACIVACVMIFLVLTKNAPEPLPSATDALALENGTRFRLASPVRVSTAEEAIRIRMPKGTFRLVPVEAGDGSLFLYEADAAADVKPETDGPGELFEVVKRGWWGEWRLPAGGIDRLDRRFHAVGRTDVTDPVVLVPSKPPQHLGLLWTMGVGAGVIALILWVTAIRRLWKVVRMIRDEEYRAACYNERLGFEPGAHPLPPE